MRKRWRLCALWFLLNVLGRTLTCHLVDTKASIQLFGEGFHRTRKFDLEVASSQPLISCNVVYYVESPNNPDFDLESLDPGQLNHCLLVNRSDSENPSAPKFQSVISHSGKVVYLFEDSLEFRLPDAVESTQAQVHVRCEANGTSQAVESNTTCTETHTCGCSNSSTCDFFRLAVKKPTTPPPVPPFPVADRRHVPFALVPSQRMPNEATDPVVNRNWRPWEPSAGQQAVDEGARPALEGEVTDREWIPWEPDPPDQPPDPDPPQAITDPDVDSRWKPWQAIRTPGTVQPIETRPPLTWVIEEDDNQHPIPDRGIRSSPCAAFVVVVAAFAALFL